MNCEVVNRQVRSATIGVDKVTSPSGRPEAFSFALKQGATTVGSIASLTDASPADDLPAGRPGDLRRRRGPLASFSQTAATWR